METIVIKNAVERIRKELAGGNPYGEKITLVAATKTQTVEAINAAIEGGVDAVAENRVQEFRDKTGLLPCPKHFIGHLQTNKVKYLLGGVELIHSCDRDELAQTIATLSEKKGLKTSVLLQVNIGNEETKGGFAFETAYDAFLQWKDRAGLQVEGFMAMLPNTDDQAYLTGLIKKMRALFERAREKDERMKFLSMGMSGDYRLCVEHGSNTVRLGSTIFGQRG